MMQMTITKGKYCHFFAYCLQESMMMININYDTVWEKLNKNADCFWEKL